MNGWWFSAWSLPDDPGGFSAKVDQLPVQTWSFEDNEDRIRGSIKFALPRSHPDFDLDEILKVDPENHANDVGSLILGYHSAHVDGTGKPIPIGSWFVSRRPDETANTQDSIVEFSGRHPLTVFDKVHLYPFDYPTLPTAEGDWKYGAESILKNTDFEDEDSQAQEFTVFVKGATSGTFQIGFQNVELAPTIDFSNNIPWDATTTQVKDAIELGVSPIISVSVSGAGEEDNPWVIQITDPSAYHFALVTSNSTNGAVTLDDDPLATTINFGGWTKSTQISTQGHPHGTYSTDGFRLSTSGEPVRTGLRSLRINGLSIYAGLQQEVRVIPGHRYRASIWVHTASNTDVFRLIIRDRFERFVASSHGLGGATVPISTWTEFAVDFTPEPGQEHLVFRFSVVGTGGVAGQEGNPIPFYVDDALLAPGAPAANMGVIANELMADIQSDHASDPRGVFVPWAIPTWDTVNDSTGSPWLIQHSITLKEGQTYAQLFEELTDKYGYQFDLRLNPIDLLFYMDIFQASTVGVDHSADDAISLVIGKDIVSGELVKSEAVASDIFARGANGLWLESGDAALATAWGRRERYVNAPDAMSNTDLNQIAQTTLSKLVDAMLGMKFDMRETDNADVLPFTHFNTRDMVNVQPGANSGIGKAARKVVSLKVDGEGGRSTNIAVNLSSEVFGSSGFAAQSEAVRRMMRKFNRIEQGFDPTGGLDPSGFGSGALPDVFVAAYDAPESVKQSADFVCDGVGDEIEIQLAVERLKEITNLSNPYGRIVLSSGSFWANTNHIFLEGDMHLMGMGVLATQLDADGGSASGALISIWDSAADIQITNMTIGVQQAMSPAIGIDYQGGSLSVNNLWISFADIGIKKAADLLSMIQCDIFQGIVWSVVSDSLGFSQTVISNCRLRGLDLVNDLVVTVTDNQFWSNQGVIIENPRALVFTGNLWDDGAVGFDALTIGGGDYDLGDWMPLYALVANNVIETFGGIDGIKVYGATNLLISNNVILEADNAIVLEDHPTTGAHCVKVDVIGNQINATHEHGIVLSNASRCSIFSNRVDSPGSSTNNTYDGIILMGSSSENDIRNNIVESDRYSAASQARHGINVSASTCLNNSYLGNRCLGTFGTSAYNNLGTGTINTWPAAGGAQGDNLL